METEYFLIEESMQFNAWIWWLLWPAVGGLVGGLGGFIIGLITANNNILRITILGTKGAGKTTFWDNLLGYETKKGPTFREELKETEINMGEKQYIVQGSVDIGGGDSFVQEYDELIKNKDFVLFIFNAEEVLNGNNDEIMAIRARLIKIGDIIKKLKMSDKETLLQYHIIGSRLDKLELKNKNQFSKMTDEVISKIGIKYLNRLPGFNKHKNFILLNLTDKKTMKTYIEKTFSNK